MTLSIRTLPWFVAYAWPGWAAMAARVSTAACTTSISRSAALRLRRRPAGFRGLLAVWQGLAMAAFAPVAGAAPGGAFLCVTNAATRALTSLRRAGDSDRVEFLRPGQSLGVVRMQVRTPGSLWQEVRPGGPSACRMWRGFDYPTRSWTGCAAWACARMALALIRRHSAGRDAASAARGPGSGGIPRRRAPARGAVMRNRRMAGRFPARGWGNAGRASAHSTAEPEDGRQVPAASVGWLVARTGIEPVFQP